MNLQILAYYKGVALDFSISNLQQVLFFLSSSLEMVLSSDGSTGVGTYDRNHNVQPHGAATQGCTAYSKVAQPLSSEHRGVVIE
jgi:hypothetical protein